MKLNYLEGYRSYIFSVLVIITSILYGFKVIDQTAFLTMVGIFGSLAGVAVRSAIARATGK